MKNYREFKLKSGKTAVAGKNAEGNEEVVCNAEKCEILIHTKEAGSPFVNIKGKASREDIREAAVICARYSRDWKTNKKDIAVHAFFKKDVYKNPVMPKGTFGVRKAKKIIVRSEEIA